MADQSTRSPHKSPVSSPAQADPSRPVRSFSTCPNPLCLLRPDETLAYLWNGPDSVARRLQTCAARHALAYVRTIENTSKKEDIQRVLKELAIAVTTEEARSAALP
jgi:hypothetical protein